MSKPQKNKNKRFGRLVCEELVTIGNRRKWRCKCDCGNYTYATAGNLATGYVKSCGCLKQEYIKGPNAKWNSRGFAV